MFVIFECTWCAALIERVATVFQSNEGKTNHLTLRIAKGGAYMRDVRFATQDGCSVVGATFKEGAVA